MFGNGHSPIAKGVADMGIIRSFAALQFNFAYSRDIDFALLVYAALWQSA